MAKKRPENAGKPRGRPASSDSMGERVLVRMDAALKSALAEYTRINGLGADSTAIRSVLTKELRAAGLLK